MIASAADVGRRASLSRVVLARLEEAAEAAATLATVGGDPRLAEAAARLADDARAEAAAASRAALALAEDS